MKIYLIAGEDSGDLHTSNFIRELRHIYPKAKFRGVGGDKMAAAGADLVAHIKDVNFMGFWEVLTHLGTIRRLFNTVKTDISIWKPDAVILVDYPGFNLRMAKFIHKQGIKVFYYISPQLWAWKKGRVQTIKKYVNHMWVILPFEKDFYQKEGLEVEFVGHPLLDVIDSNERVWHDPPTIALLPGSRKQEIQRVLPIMLEMPERFPNFRFIIAGAPSQSEAFYQPFLTQKKVTLMMGQTYEVLQQADYALVTSGTATLETALFKVPQVVCYKGGLISYHIGKRLVKVSFISLVNLIVGRKVVSELIQHELTPDKLEKELLALGEMPRERRIQLAYSELRQKLGQEGASLRAAQLFLRQMNIQTEEETNPLSEVDNT